MRLEQYTAMENAVIAKLLVQNAVITTFIRAIAERRR
jgi:hypothetical protein